LFEELFAGLAKKYGERFVWIDVRREGKYFLDELESELNENHPLYKRGRAALAKSTSRDDVLFLLDEDAYAIVHLTYSHKNEKGFPMYKKFFNLQEVFQHIEEECLTEG